MTKSPYDFNGEFRILRKFEEEIRLSNLPQDFHLHQVAKTIKDLMARCNWFTYELRRRQDLIHKLRKDNKKLRKQIFQLEKVVNND